jgi:hypothetical protein
MASKGMSMTLTIIVAAVVILVTALVLLTIFGTGITPISTLSEARNSCGLQGKQLCLSTGNLPPTWSLKTVNVAGEMKSCNEICGDNVCHVDEITGEKSWVSAQCAPS